MMKTVFKANLNTKTFATAKSFTLQKVKEKDSVNYKFYQKLFVIFISLSTFLIFPESPRELENICASYYSIKSCNAW